MSGQVQFEGENSQSAFRSREIFGMPTTPKMISFMIKKGIAKDERTAGNVLIGMVIAFVVLAIIVIIFFVFRYQPFEKVYTIDDFNSVVLQ